MPPGDLITSNYQYDAVRLQRHVVVDDNGCWIWQAAQTNGYGYFRFEDKSVPAHRASYTIFVGPIPPGMVVDHLCRVKLCVNPEHLEAVTSGENNRRGQGWSGRNARKTHCPQGHPYTERNTVKWRGTRSCRRCKNKYINEGARRRRERQHACG